MYTRILVALENSASDRAVIDHIASLARLTGASVLLLHVADGWAARHFVDLDLRESQEMREDRAYLENVAAELRQHGLQVDARLALGDPASEISRAAETAGADLPLHQGPAPRRDRRQGAAPREDPGSAGARRRGGLTRIERGEQ
jgi:nucleotide-binding universal stress UspA family protein